MIINLRHTVCLRHIINRSRYILTENIALILSGLKDKENCLVFSLTVYNNYTIAIIISS